MSWQGVAGIILAIVIFGFMIFGILQATGITDVPWPDISPHGWVGP